MPTFIPFEDSAYLYTSQGSYGYLNVFWGCGGTNVQGGTLTISTISGPSVSDSRTVATGVSYSNSTTIWVGYGGSWTGHIRAVNNQTGGIYEQDVTGTASSPPATYPPSWSDNSLATPVAGVAYSDGVSATNSPTYSISVGSLPAGLSLNTSTGAVTGTPTVSGAYSFTIQASNGDGTITQAFSGNIAGGLKVWNGTSWASKTAQVWSGTAWVTKPVKTWTGSAWVNTP